MSQPKIKRAFFFELRGHNRQDHDDVLVIALDWIEAQKKVDQFVERRNEELPVQHQLKVTKGQQFYGKVIA